MNQSPLSLFINIIKYRQFIVLKAGDFKGEYQQQQPVKKALGKSDMEKKKEIWLLHTHFIRMKNERALFPFFFSFLPRATLKGPKKLCSYIVLYFFLLCRIKFKQDQMNLDQWSRDKAITNRLKTLLCHLHITIHGEAIQGCKGCTRQPKAILYNLAQSFCQFVLRSTFCAIRKFFLFTLKHFSLGNTFCSIVDAFCSIRNNLCLRTFLYLKEHFLFHRTFFVPLKFFWFI